MGFLLLCLFNCSDDCPVRCACQIRYRACFHLKDVPLERLTDEAFAMMLLRLQAFLSKDNRMEVVYEVLLPFLLDKENGMWTPSLRTTIESVEQPPWCSAQRSGTCFYRSALLALKFVLWRRGVSDAHAKLFTLVLRLQYFLRVEGDLRHLVASQHRLLRWEEVVLSTACKQLARAALKSSHSCAREIVHHTLLSVKALVDQALLAPDGSSMDAGSPNSLIVEPTFAVNMPSLADIGHVMGNHVVDPFIGPSLLSTDSACLDVLLPPSGEPNLSSFASVLEAGLELCEAFRARAHSSNAAIAMYHICDTIESLFLHQFPVPAPPGTDGSSCPWSQPAPSVDAQLRMIRLLCGAMMTYVTAVKSLPEYATLSGRHIVTASVVAACFDCVARLKCADGSVSPLARALGSYSDPAAVSEPSNRLYPRRLWMLSSRSFAGLSFVDRTESCLLVTPDAAHRRHLVAQYWIGCDTLLQSVPGARELYSFETGVTASRDTDIIEFTGSFLEEVGAAGVPKTVFADAVGQLRSNVTTIEALSELERVGMWYSSHWESWPEFASLRYVPAVCCVYLDCVVTWDVMAYTGPRLFC